VILINKKSSFFKLLFVCWILNIIWIIIYFSFIIYFIVDPHSYIEFFIQKNFQKYYEIISIFFIVPILILWIYNLRFFYKYDRYSRAIVLLIFLNGLYSPYYFYQVHFKGRKLKNKGIETPVIGNTINLEDYESEEDFNHDIK
jgi:hypothetical protein